MTCDIDDDNRWDCVTKEPGETLPVVLSAFNLCANFWEPNDEYALGEYVWPRREDGKGDGFCFQCTTAGRSARKQPRWNEQANAVLPKLDGSAGWTCRVSGMNGISAITGTPIAEPPDGIFVSAILVSEGTKLLVDYSGGTLDEDYEVRFLFTIAGRLRVGRQLVRVRKK